ncbi:EcsC family protein [Planctomycetota bacterium]|nr:EcsC family protein [Planctomycetota bacterium]
MPDESIELRPLNEYESGQVSAIQDWKNAEPGIVGKSLGLILEPAANLIRKIIPEGAISGAIEGSAWLSYQLTDLEDIKRDGEVDDLEELRRKELELSDRLADEVHNWAIGLATVEGAGTGAIGIFGAPIDVPALVVMALRCIYKIGACYGYKLDQPEDRDFVLSILSAASANSVEEKLVAQAALKNIEITIAKVTWKKMAEKAAEKAVSKEGAVIAVKTLSKQLGINLTKRKALSAIPVIGAAVGGSVNGWYLKEVGWAARRSFQERWLIENHKVAFDLGDN